MKTIKIDNLISNYWKILGSIDSLINFEVQYDQKKELFEYLTELTFNNSLAKSNYFLLMTDENTDEIIGGVCAYFSKSEEKLLFNNTLVKRLNCHLMNKIHKVSYTAQDLKIVNSESDLEKQYIKPLWEECGESKKACLNLFWVSKKFRGQGYGKELFNQFTEDAKKLDEKRISLLTTSFNNYNYYEKNNFVLDKKYNIDKTTSYLIFSKEI